MRKPARPFLPRSARIMAAAAVLSVAIGLAVPAAVLAMFWNDASSSEPIVIAARA
jgi:hypothetical protein